MKDAEPASQKTILMVDDEMGVRAAVKTVLRAAGFRVIEAINGVDALRLWQRYSGEIDLLFSDMMMPGMNGLALADRLHLERPDLKVIIFSGHRPGDYAKGRLGEENIVYLTKPCTPDCLAKTVRGCLENRSSAI